MDKKCTFRIGFLLIDGFALMSFAAAVEPLRAANLLAGYPLYDLFFLTGDGKMAKSSGVATVAADFSLKDCPALDLLLVVAGGDPMRLEDACLDRGLKRLQGRNLRLGGISGGPVLLQKAGLMKGRRFTVHWEHAPGLLEVYPDCLLQRSLYVMDRDRVTCAGGTAPLDMMLALITQHHGADFARSVSDWFMHVDIRAGVDPQRAGLEERFATHNPTIILAIEMMENHLADNLGLGQLAILTKMSARQLNRLFQQTFQKSTMAFYRDLRLEKAHNLLRQSTLSVTDIALATGFASSAHFSSSFRKRYGRPPSGMRNSLKKP